MRNNFPPLKEKAFPKAPSYRASFGVGAVVLGLAIGSGELILWPQLIANFGLGILWGATIGILIEYFINQEVARHALATGESFFTSSARIFKWIIPFWIVSAILLYIWPGWAGAMGATLKALVGFGSINFWAWGSLALILTFVLLGKVAYNTMELVVKIIVSTFFILLIFVSFLNLDLEILKQAFFGLLNFGWLPETMPISTFMGAIVFAGAGGLFNVCISLWYRDKQFGMGSYVEQIKNPLNSKPQAVSETGYTFKPTAQNITRFKKWMRIVYIDQGIVFGLFSLIGILLVSLNAYAVLEPLGITPDGIDIIIEQSKIFGNIWGPIGSNLFLSIVYLELFSTLWIVLDVFSRIVGDIIYTNSRVGPFKKYLKVAKQYSAHSIYYFLFITLVIINAILIPFGQPFNFLVISAVLGGIVMAVYIPIILYINNFTLHKKIRPSIFTNMILVSGTIFYIYFSVRVLLDWIIS